MLSGERYFTEKPSLQALSHFRFLPTGTETIMDPLSVTASVIALGQVCGSIGQGIQEIRQLGLARAEFADLLNEVFLMDFLPCYASCG
jgi:hypothetical protein